MGNPKILSEKLLLILLVPERAVLHHQKRLKPSLFEPNPNSTNTAQAMKNGHARWTDAQLVQQRKPFRKISSQKRVTSSEAITQKRLVFL